MKGLRFIPARSQIITKVIRNLAGPVQANVILSLRGRVAVPINSRAGHQIVILHPAVRVIHVVILHLPGQEVTGVIRFHQGRIAAGHIPLPVDREAVGRIQLPQDRVVQVHLLVQVVQDQAEAGDNISVRSDSHIR